MILGQRSTYKGRRWRLLWIFGPLVAGLLLFFVTSNPQQSLFEPPRNYPEFSAKVLAATYQVGCGERGTGSGWGVEVGGSQFVVTNHHVISKCTESNTVLVSNESTDIFEAEIIASDGFVWGDDQDTYRDLAVLKSSQRIATLPIQLEPAQLGQWVMLAGYPGVGDFSSLLAVANGTVTSLHESGVLVTDVVLNDGNSGGPLVNSRGELVGTIFGGASRERFYGLGYAQGIQLHCGFVFSCVDGEPNTSIKPPSLQEKVK